MPYQKRKGYKSIGKSQNVVMIRLIEQPMTVNKLIDDTGLGAANVKNALKGLLFKGYIVKDKHKFKVNMDNNESAHLATFGVYNNSTAV